MKKLLGFAFIALCIAACTNQQDTAAVKQIATIKDSLITQLKVKDSSMMAYINSINTIQKNIDTLMLEAHALKMHGEGPPKSSKDNIVDELRTIGTLMVKNRRELNELQSKLKKSGEQNQGLTDLGEELAKQLNEKDSEIATIQNELVKTKASLASVVKQFNDSLTIISEQRSQINILQVKGNTVYYIAGKEGVLKKQGIIEENGGVVGLGKVPTPGPDMNTSGFTTGDLTTLHEIPLSGRLGRLVTPHPTNSYRVAAGQTDKIIITDPEDFWSKSKYLIVITR